MSPHLNGIYYITFLTVGVFACAAIYVYFKKKEIQLIQNLKYILFLTIGFAVSQFFHTLVFWRTYGNEAPLYRFLNPYFPAYQGFIYLVYLVLVALAMLGFLFIFIEKPHEFFILTIPLLLISQIGGRSLYKLVFETSYILIVFFSMTFIKAYSLKKLESLKGDRIRFMYKELWNLLGITNTWSIFWLGTAGVVFASAVITKYFAMSETLTQHQTWRFFASLLYSGFGILVLIYWPLIKRIRLIRQKMF